MKTSMRTLSVTYGFTNIFGKLARRDHFVMESRIDCNFRLADCTPHRRLCIDLSYPFVTALQEACSRETCPEMKAGEWLYLCAAHASSAETECCAIDYIVHTLDGASALLNQSRYFPSRSVAQFNC